MNKIFVVKPMLIEKVRLSIKGDTRVIDNENGAWYEIILFNTGEFELHSIDRWNSGYECKRPARIPFSPIISDNFDEYKWGDRE